MLTPPVSHLAPRNHLCLLFQTSGLLVWVLIGGTEYSHVPALGWVMFVAILYWVLTIGLFIVYLSRAHVRATWVPWNKLVTKRKTKLRKY